jgi:cell division protein FtsQ
MKKEKSIGKIKVIACWVIISGYLLVVLGLISDKSERFICENQFVNILDSNEFRFINKNDVQSVLSENNIVVLGQPMGVINTKKMEEILISKALIKEAEVYRSGKNSIVIDVIQREPILRIIDEYNRSFYMDAEGYVLPVSSKYSAYVMVANGNFSKPEDFQQVGIDYHKEEYKKDMKILRDLYKMTLFIHKNPLWNAQFEQIYVNHKGEFELIPRVGSHIIFFGDIYNMEAKFRKLYGLYFAGFNNMGWNNYEKINLKYNNQVICTKR